MRVAAVAGIASAPTTGADAARPHAHVQPDGRAALLATAAHGRASRQMLQGPRRPSPHPTPPPSASPLTRRCSRVCAPMCLGVPCGDIRMHARLFVCAEIGGHMARCDRQWRHGCCCEYLCATASPDCVRCRRHPCLRARMRSAVATPPPTFAPTLLGGTARAPSCICAPFESVRTRASALTASCVFVRAVRWCLRVRVCVRVFVCVRACGACVRARVCVRPPVARRGHAVFIDRRAGGHVRFACESSVGPQVEPSATAPSRRNGLRELTTRPWSTPSPAPSTSSAATTAPPTTRTCGRAPTEVRGRTRSRGVGGTPRVLRVLAGYSGVPRGLWSTRGVL
jgi:hypothetical protein